MFCRSLNHQGSAKHITQPVDDFHPLEMAEYLRSKGKTHDVVIYKNGKPILIGEFNFYNTTGSKPISIAESYIEMHKVAKEHNVEFLWVTDGPAWHKMEQPLLLSMREIDWVLNYRMMDLIRRILK